MKNHLQTSISTAILMMMLAAFGTGLYAQCDKVVVGKARYYFNSPVKVIKKSGNTVYMGGNFSDMHRETGIAAPVNVTTGLPPLNFPEFIGSSVEVIIPDGSGGWFAGGSFSRVGDEVRENLVHINSSNQVTDLFEGFRTNGKVRSLNLNGGNLYMGGDFTVVGDILLSGAVSFNTGTGETNLLYPEINGTVNTIIPDGIGGWFLGGQFTKVGSIDRSNLAQINSAGQLTNFAPGPNSTINSLLLSGNTLFVGGSFSTIAGESRQGLAAIDISTGLVIQDFNADLNASASSFVSEMHLEGNFLYLAGTFASIGGQGRNSLASVNATNGAVTNWNPNPDKLVRAIQVANNRLFVGGDFTTIADSVQEYLCSFNITDPFNITLESWNLRPNRPIRELHLSGNTLYMGGEFWIFLLSTFVWRSYAAAVDILTNNFTTWNPACNNVVSSIHTIGSTVYLGGTFTSVNGNSNDNRHYLASVNNTDGMLNAFNPNAGGSVLDLETGPAGEIFTVGSGIKYTGGQVRYHACAINATTGQLNSWNPEVNNSVYDITSSGSLLYLGGSFDTVGFLSSPTLRYGVAAFDLTSGNLNASFDFSGSSNGAVRSIALLGNTLYIGGEFTDINGTPMNHIASADATTGTISNWNPNIDRSVYTILPTDTAIYIGGDFFNIGSKRRYYLASLNPFSGEASATFFQASSLVKKLVLQSNLLYVVGGFSHLSTGTNQYRDRGAAINIVTNSLTSFDLGADNTVNTIAFNGMIAYAGGDFTYLKKILRNHLCAFDATTGELTSWNPNAHGGVNALEIIGSTVYAGGSFSYVGASTNTYSRNLAAIDTNGNLLPGFNAGMTGYVNCLAASGTSLFVGGELWNVNGKNYLVQVDAATGASTSWINNPDGKITAMKLINDTLIVGGNFFYLGGFPRQYMGAVSVINSNFSFDWRPTLNGIPSSIEKAGNKIFVAGNFTVAGVTPRNHIAAFDLPSGNLSNWNPNIDGVVNALSYANNRLYACGAFSKVGSYGRHNLASIDTASGLPIAWNPDPIGTVNSIFVESGNIYVGGEFGSISGINFRNYAQLIDNCCALYYWSGTGNWSNTSNWCNGLVPVDSIDAVIESGSVTVAGATSVRKLTVLNGASANILDGQTLTLFGDIDNRSGSLGGAGTLQFSGNNPKYINGTVNIANLNYNMTGANLSLSNGNLNVSGTLTFNTDGFINLFGDGNLRLTGTSSSIAGYNSNRNILLTGGGNINSKFTIEHIGTGGRTGDVIFPVSLNGYYVPVTINNAGTSDNFSIRLVGGVYDAYDANGNPTGLLKNHDVVGITWLIDEEVAGGNNASITLQWPLALETYNFNRNAVSLRRYTGGAWNNDNGPIGAASGSDPYTYSRIGISSFSPFSLGSGAAFPLNFLSFSGRKVQTSIALSWVTDNEVNTSHFDIERSADGLIFSSIGKVTAANQGGQHNYDFTDPQPKRGVNFYRLRQVDLDGGFMFSNTISLTMDGFGVPGIWPNPVKDELRITGMDVSAISQLQVIDASGRMVKQFTPSPSQSYTIPELPAGIYMLKIMRKDQTSVTLRFMKQ